MALERVQAGKEATRGTAVAADTVILGEVKYVPDRTPVIPADNIGLNVNGYRAVLGGKLVSNTLKISRGYFQILPLLFSLFLRGGVTATETTPSQGDYAWDFTPDLDSTNAPDTLTLEFGDSAQAFEVEHVMGEKLTISGSIPQEGGDAPISLELDFFGKQNTKTTFTSSLEPPVVNEMSGFLTRLFFDDTWAGVGGTEKTNILRAFDIELIGGKYPEFHGGQVLTFDKFGEGKISGLATLTLDTAAAAIALHDAIGTMKVFRMLFEGPQIGTGVKHSLTLDFSGIVMEPKPGDSKDKETSLATIQIEFVYDPTGAKLMVPKVVTNVSAI
jgi:hypothetical protein